MSEKPDYMECPCCGEPEAVPATILWCRTHEREPFACAEHDDYEPGDALPAGCVVALAAWCVDDTETCPGCGCLLAVEEGYVEDTVMALVRESCQGEE